MFFSDPLRLARALAWLSSDVNLGPMQVLAVVIDPSGRCLERLQAQWQDIHQQSEHALILVMGDSWRTSDDVDLRGISDKEVLSWLPGFWGTLKAQKTVGSSYPALPGFAERQFFRPLELILEILNINEAALPGIFLRRRDEPPVWVALPDDEHLVELLKQLSLGARKKSIQAILEWVELAGMVFPSDEVQAWDALFSEGAKGKKARAHDDWREPELARVAATWRTTRRERWTLPHAESLLVERLRDVAADHHYRALRTALFAHASCDWGTVVTNISGVIEGSVARGLFAASRLRMGVRRPDYVDWWDPEAGEVPRSGPQNFNKPRGELIGVVNEDTRIPWLPPNLNPGLTLLEHEPEYDIRSDTRVRKLMDSIARCAVTLRNPPAHGDPVDERTARASWKLLSIWYRTGCAAAMSRLGEACRYADTPAIQRVLQSIDTSSFSPAGVYLIASKNAKDQLDTLGPILEQVTSLRARIAEALAGSTASLRELESLLDGLRIANRAGLIQRVPAWPSGARNLLEFLAPREKLSERFTRAFPESGLLGAKWLGAASNADADREGLQAAEEYLRARIAEGHPDVPGCRSNANLLDDVERRLRLRNHPKWQTPTLALEELDTRLQGIEEGLDAIRARYHSDRHTLDQWCD